MNTASILIVSEILGIVSTLLKNKSGDNEGIERLGQVIGFGVGAVRAGTAANRSLGELRDQLTILNVENRYPTEEEIQAWRQRSQGASSRIQAAAEAGRVQVNTNGDIETPNEPFEGNEVTEEETVVETEETVEEKTEETEEVPPVDGGRREGLQR